MQSVYEKIYRVWSERKEDRIAVRIQYSSLDRDGCRIFTMLRREEWD
ncbi:MAG TPA: hypothetical protein VMZ52_15050 [Bryobacteraceae bacterium]|nr:hypothetical protein [Bryobacteraceae bacterium]